MLNFQWSKSSSRPSNKQSAHRRKTKLDFVPLEDRRLLATFAVTNIADGPVAAAGDLPGSLRQAIFDSNSKPWFRPIRDSQLPISQLVEDPKILTQRRRVRKASRSIPWRA